MKAWIDTGVVTASQLYLKKKKWLITAGDVKDILETYTTFLKSSNDNILHHYSEPAGCQTNESVNQARNYLE